MEATSKFILVQLKFRIITIIKDGTQPYFSLWWIFGKVQYKYSLTNSNCIFFSRYRFLYVHVGAPGRCHDSQVFESTSLKRMLDCTTLLSENSKRIGGVDVPVVLLADSAKKF